MKTPIKYFGSKNKLSETIINLIPPHKCYVEVFGGSGAVLFNKPISEVEVYNDINLDIVNLFRVLRDLEKSAKLYQMLELTLYSRAEFDSAKKALQDNQIIDDVYRAWCVFVLYNQSIHVRRGYVTSWGYSIIENTRTDAWWNKIQSISAIHNRLSNVQIENLDYKDILTKYDTEQTVFYLDPPYTHASRSEKVSYENEINVQDHDELVMRLLECRGACILSGYENPIYKPLDQAGWRRVEIQSRTSIGPQSQNTSRTEILWYNRGFTSKKQLTLFED
jgi:DNA adenine methylase